MGDPVNLADDQLWAAFIAYLKEHPENDVTDFIVWVNHCAFKWHLVDGRPVPEVER